MDTEFICFNLDSWRYPTLAEFKDALKDLDVKVITNELFLDLQPIPYFVVSFRKKDVDYDEWCLTKQRIIQGRLWKYIAHKIDRCNHCKYNPNTQRNQPVKFTLQMMI
jgi:hypothetical protein